MSDTGTATVTVHLCDGVRVVVPDSLDLITPYVLREQHDWFEDEIRFLRRFLRPGQQVIDIGANVGVYALAMARAVGEGGRVWAFEPAAATAALLAAGVEANGFTHVSLERAALADHVGEAVLALSRHAETNTLAQGPLPAGAGEVVPVTTLDACLDRLGWRAIDFVKIDAEGAEERILEGGARFLAELSPLLQYEIRSADRPDLALVRSLAARGYASYRLVPGLDLLMPFDPGQPVDEFLLNLFACKPATAQGLAAAGWLVAEAPRAFDRPREALAPYGWRAGLAACPHAAALIEAERRTGRSVAFAVDEALALFLFSRDSRQPATARLAALQASLQQFTRLVGEHPTAERLASLARVAQCYGARAIAVRALGALLNVLVRDHAQRVQEPFLAPGARFDDVPTRGNLGHWLLAACLEEAERLSTHSSFYSGRAARPRLEAIQALGYGGEEMQRRLALLQRRFGAPAG